MLEASLVSLDGHRHRALGNSGHQLAAAVGCDVVEAGDLALLDTGGRFFLAGAAGSRYTSVGVIGLGGVAISLEELEAIVHETTIAALVAEASSTVDELLLREGDDRVCSESSGDGDCTLGSASGGECPT